MKPRIIFVDDQVELLDGLRRIMHRMRNVWDFDFAGNGEEALRIFEQYKVDVLVTDMRMPGLDGTQLCEQIQSLSPQTPRIVLSGQSDDLQFNRAIKLAHCYLSKPCSADQLIEAIEQALLLREKVCVGTEPPMLLKERGLAPRPVVQPLSNPALWARQENMLVITDQTSTDLVLS